MALPAKLKDFNVFNEGESYLGQCKTFTPPKLTRLMENWRGGGMNGSVKRDNGVGDLEAEQVYGGLMLGILRQFGVTEVDGVQLRFVGAYQADDSGAALAVEIVIRGRHEEIDMGDQEVGEDTEFKVKTTCSYYKLTINGAVLIELDFLRGIEIVNGVDRTAAIRQIVGAN